MKWWPSEPRRGDMIRVLLGSVYHYGIFIDEDTVVQFGPPPGTEEYGKGKDLKVCITSAEFFSCGKIIETAVLDKKEARKRISPEKTAETALSRVGEGGYDLIHNNCEHFAYECVFGVKRSTQEEDARKRWNSRPVLDCYFAVIPDRVDVGHVIPPARDELIAATANERLRAERYFVWELLGAAFSRSFGYRMDELELKLTSCGKWVCSKAEFSLTHTDGLAAVAVSNAPVGIDAECTRSFSEKHGGDIAALADKMLTRRERREYDGSDPEVLLTYWTRKESIFKSLGKPSFRPERTESDTKNTVSLKLPDIPGYIMSVHGSEIGALRCYTYRDGKTAAADFEKIGTGVG